MFSIDKLKYTDSGNFILLAGPCAIESEDIAFRTAEELVRISDKYRIPLIFKGSFKKANRSRLDSFTGIGDLKALQILKKSVPNSPFRPSPTSTPSTMRPWHRSLPTSCRSLLFSPDRPTCSSPQHEQDAWSTSKRDNSFPVMPWHSLPRRSKRQGMNGFSLPNEVTHSGTKT